MTDAAVRLWDANPKRGQSRGSIDVALTLKVLW